MAANNIYIQVDVNSQTAQAAVNTLNQAIAQTGPTAEKSSQQSTKALSTVNVSVKQTTEAFGEMASAVAGLGIGRLIQNMVQMSTEMSRAQTMMEAFTGSAQEAKEIYEEIQQVARQGIFNVAELEQAGQALLGFGYAAKNVPGMIKIITDQVTAMGGSIESVNSLIRLFGRIADKEFSGANDLFRLLPANGIKVTEALRTALAKATGAATASVEDVQKAMKGGITDWTEVVRVIFAEMEKQTKDAGLKINDLSKFLKNMNDMLREANRLLLGPEAFGPAVKKLTDFLKELIVPLAAFFDLLKKMPEWLKEVITYVTAAAVGFTALYWTFNLISKISGPLIDAIAGIAKVITTRLIPALVELAPELVELLPLFAAIAATAFGAYQMFPETAANLFGKMKDGMKDALAAIKDMIVDMANDSGLIAAKKSIFDPTADTGTSLTKPKFEEMDKQMEEWATSAQKTLLEALGHPVDAVVEKYVALLDKLGDKLKEFGISAQADVEKYGEQLVALEHMEISAKGFAKEKQQIEEVAKLEEEKTKGSYEAQIAYIEAKDEKELKLKVANLDTITGLQVASIQTVAKIQEKAIQDEVNRRNEVLKSYEGVLGSDRVKAIQEANQKDAAAKQLYIAQKASDEEQKIRLEGWKKANDAIIEEQKKVYDAFKSEFDELFDALTDRSKSLGKALGDMFKKLALGEIKQLFSSNLAANATQAAGYGYPEADIRKGGILSQLFTHGMPPRPPLPPPVPYAPSSESSDVLYARHTFNNSVDTFAAAVNVYAAATIRTKDSANRMADATDDVATASAATGVSADLIRAVIQAESSGNPLAVSNKGAQGLMQLMPGTAADMGVTDPFNASQSVMGGAKYLKGLLRTYGGSEAAALAAYNMGPEAYTTAMFNQRPLPPETRAFVARVQANLARLRAAQGGSDTTALPSLPLFALPPGFATASGALSYTPTGVAASMPLLPPSPNISMPSYGAGADLFSTASGLPLLPPGPDVAMPNYGTGAALFSTTASGAPSYGLPPGPDVAMPNYGAGPDLPSALTTGATPTQIQSVQKTGMLAHLRSLLGANKTGISGVLGGLLGIGGVAAAHGQTMGQESLNRAAWGTQMAQIKSFLGIGQALGGTTSLGSIATSQAAGALYSMGGMALLSKGLQQRSALATALGGGGLGVGMALSSPKLLAHFAGQFGGVGLGLASAAATGIGAGIFASGFQRGGGAGVAMDIGGGALAGAGIGTMIAPGLGTAIGAAVGAGVGLLTGVVRLFVKTEQEKIRAGIKQVYGIDISNRQILTQIQTDIDQKYGGNVAIGIRSQDVQDIVRLYALSTGQAANLPRPMYSATIAQSTQGLQMQPVYQGGVLVQNPYTGPTTYQYQSAVTTAQGLMSGTNLGVPGAGALQFGLLNSQTLNILAANPSAVAISGAAAARAGDSRLSTTQAMQEPLTALS